MPDQPAVDVSIAAHYVPERVPFLAEILLAIAGWQGRDVTVKIDTNDMAIGRDPALTDALARCATSDVRIDIVPAGKMAHPWHLTWQHKPRLAEWAASAKQQDLFIYVEDDIVVTGDNLRYFTEYLDKAKALGLIPGLMRFEYGPDGTIFSPDFRGYHAVEKSEIVKIGDQAFVASRFPYWAGFIMDRDLAREYLASDWSDLAKADRQLQSIGHSCRVQSAWALTYESVPDGLHSRYIVPVDADLVPLPCCQVWHSANNYVRSKTHSFGTVRMDKVFRRPGLSAHSAHAAWNTQALARRIGDKLRRELAKFSRPQC